MIVLPYSVPDEEIKKLVLQWLALLAQENYSAVLELLYLKNDETSVLSQHFTKEEPYWTSQLLENAIKNYGPGDHLEGEPFYKVTPLEQLSEEEASIFFHLFKVNRQYSYGLDQRYYNGMVHVNLPLDGQCSDLTARLCIRKVDNGIALELDDIHVM